MQRMFRRAALVFVSLATCLAASAADIGGWMQEQSRAQQRTEGLSCAQVAAQASQASTDSAQRAYQAALCYLHGEQADVTAAKAWLAKAAQGNHLPAHRMLSMIERIETGQHAAAAHCHDLGEGRQLCHGAARQAASQ
jgi:TPR repeat protein